MGLGGLHVVGPREPAFRTHPEALALATHDADLLAGAVAHASLVDALAGVSLTFAKTGYPREYGPPLVDVEAAAARAAAHLGGDPGDVAFVFSPERTGLADADVQRCTFSCAIDADPVAPAAGRRRARR